MPTNDEKIQALATLIETDTSMEFARRYPDTAITFWESHIKVTVTQGQKYTRVDVGKSGKYMVDGDGNIFGVKAYGVIHKGHRFGTLDTIKDYFWGGYRAEKRHVGQS